MRWLCSVGVLLFVTGCPSKDVDDDHDGVRAETDCDDNNPDVFPGNDEVCNGLDENCDGRVDEGVTQLFWPDTDGDGVGDATAEPVVGCERPADFSDNDLDCDDDHPEINPDADEDCSQLDMDCDGDPVNGLDTDDYYVDADLDGFGDDNLPQVSACTPADGLTDVGGDCDDTLDTIHPGADEICDGFDQDCDADIDEDAIDAGHYFLDADLDGFGDDDTEVVACAEIPGRSLVGGDCDDLDNTAFPGNPELCDEGVDNDCDPATDDDDSPTAPTFYTDIDQDGFGNTLAPVQQCLQADLAIFDGDCDDNVATTFPGANELCNGGVDDDCDPSTNEEDSAVWYFDQDHDGFGTENDTFTGCSPPPDYVQVPGDCDDTDPALNPDLTPGCDQLHCGLISLSEHWKATVTHTVTCDVDVEGAAKPVLTIDDGAIVRFHPNAELRIGDGAEGELQVDGDILGVLFTSAELFPAPGDWDGVLIGEDDRGSEIVGLTVEYGGKNGEGGVSVEGGDPTFDRLTSRLNLNDGLHITGSEPLVHDSALVENTNNGLFVDEGSGLSRATVDGDQGPSFTDNVVTDNGALPITIPGSHADEIALSSVLSPNDDEEIELLSGTLRFNGTWFDHEIPYRVADGASIEVEDGPQAELFIEDGVEIFFGSGAEITVGEGAEGRLELIDGPVGVVFNATDDVISSSDNWDGITFGPNDGGSIVRNLTIAYGGGNGNGNIDVNNSAPLFDGITSRLSDTAGLHVTGANAAPEIRNSTFTDNDEDGVFVESSSGIARSLFGPTFVNNVLTGNGISPVVLPPTFIGELDPSTQFSGNGSPIRIHGGQVLEDALWRELDEDYEILDDVDIGGPQDPVVTIEDDVVFLFDRDTQFTVGVVDDGALLINAPNGVRMTSSDPAPGEGDWDGIQIGRNGPLGPQTDIDGLIVEFAGGSNVGTGGGVEVVDRDTCQTIEPIQTLRHVTVVSSSKVGFSFEASSQPSVTDSTISGPLGGCWEIIGTTTICNVHIVAYANNDCPFGSSFGTFPLVGAELLDTTSTYPGPVTLVGTKVLDDLTLNDIGVPYQLLDTVEVGNDATQPVLTVSSGVEIQFGAGAGLEVAEGGDLGALVVEPGAVLTSTEANPAPGDWEGVTIGDACLPGTSLTGATIEYGGANGNGALYLDECEVGTYDSLTITDSSSCGVFVEPDDSTVQVTNLTGSGNVGGDVCIIQ